MQKNWIGKFDYLIRVVELVVHEASDDAGFADGLVPQEDELVLGESRNGSHGDFGSTWIRSGSRSRSRQRFIGQIEISEPRSKFASFVLFFLDFVWVRIYTTMICWHIEKERDGDRERLFFAREIGLKRFSTKINY